MSHLLNTQSNNAVENKHTQFRQNVGSGWVLAEYAVVNPRDGDSQNYTTVEIRSLLSTMLTLLHQNSPTPRLAHQSQWTSQCGRFCVVYDKPDISPEQLYCQKRADYFAGVELYIDDMLAIAIREPMWRHLQHQTLNPTKDTEVLSYCLVAMQKSIASPAAIKPGAEPWPANADSINRVRCVSDLSQYELNSEASAVNPDNAISDARSAACY